MVPAIEQPTASTRYRMPAEWESHAGTWLSWPHNRETWPGCFAQAEEAMVAATSVLSEVETVHINVLDKQHEAAVVGRLRDWASLERVEFHRIATNDAWIRDHGAIFVVAEDASAASLLALDFRFNAWGGKYPPFDLDDAAAAKMAEALGVPVAHHSIVLEGGSVDVDGAGALLTTEQCLLNPNRNPGLEKTEVEAYLKDAFGVTTIVWLGDGIEGDDTDGHIDELTRFVAARTVVTAVETDEHDPNFAALSANRRALADARIGGCPLEIIDLPMPSPVYYRQQRLPASYANFYVANQRVLAPAFGDAADDAAAAVLQSCFPGHRVVQIDCRALVVGLGGLHCLTQQIPMARGGLS